MFTKNPLGHGRLLPFWLLFCVLTVAAIAPVQAATEVGVVDMTRIMKEAKVAQDMRVQLEKRQKAFNEELTKQDESLKKEQQDLRAKQESMKPEEFEERRAAFEKRVLDLRQNAQKKGRALEEAYAQALLKVKKEVVTIVDSVANEKEFGLVFSGQNVIWAQESHDITQSVLDEINKRLTHVDIDSAPAK